MQSLVDRRPNEKEGVEKPRSSRRKWFWSKEPEKCIPTGKKRGKEP